MAVKAKAEITLYKIISVDKVVRYHLLQSSTLAAPSKPADGAVIGSNWSKTEPSYTSGSTSTLYFVDQTVLSNGTLKYSEVSKSSSYEAAKEAWNKANNAQKTADSANSKIDGLQVGGRNMLRGSSFDNQPNVNNTYIKYKNNSVKLTVDNTNGATGTIKYVSISSLTQSWNLSDVIGKTITISMWVYVEKSKQVDGYEFRIVYTHEGNTKWFNPDTKYPYYVPDADKLKVGWNYLYASFTIPSDSTQADFNFTLCARAGKTSTAWFSSPKAEIGNVATDWTPAPEDAIADTYQEYYLSASQTALSGGFWTTTAPTWVNGKYMWSRTVKVDGAGNKTYTPSQNGVCIAGAKGDTGASGKGIKSTAITYQLSASQTKAPTGTWLSSPPKTDIATPYLWTRTVITYTDNTTSTSYSISSTLDSLMVGGRNLFKHSSLVGEQLTCDSVNGCNSIDTEKYEDIGYHIVTPNAGNLNNGILFVFKDFTTLGLKKGDTITFSIDVKGTSDEHNPFLKIWLPKDDPNAWWVGDQSDNSEFVPTNEFKRASVTFTIPNTYELSYIFFGVHGNIQSDLYIRNAKLEKGTVATDWTPAPEDLETRVSNAETAISNNAKEIKLKASQDEVTTISDNLEVLTKTSTEFKQTVEGWQLNWDKLISTGNAEIASHKDYITFDKGDIILGESSNDLKLKITNDSIQFKGTSDTEVTPDSDATAWITGKTFHISDGEIQNSLKFGDILMKPTSSGNLAIDDYVEFGPTVRIGNPSSRYTRINSNGLMVNNENTVIAQIGYGTAGDPNGGNSVYAFYTFGERKTGTLSGGYSLVEGFNNTATGFCAHAEGWPSIASGTSAHAEGSSTASGDDSHAEGGSTTASGDDSHTEGMCTTASGQSSHAEGEHTEASEIGAHAEGSYTKAMGAYSHAEGGSTTASGDYSHAGGVGTIAKNDYQTVIGRYNANKNSAFIIGNGSSDTERSNALTVDWDGNITGKSLTSANDLKLGFGSSNIFKPYFTKGDSITLTIYAVGYVTTRGKEVAMYVPLSRPIIAGGSVSVASVNGLTIRQNGKYLYSSSASNSVNPSSFRAAIVGSGCGVNIVATFGNTVNATVNDVCSITASIKITFS
jgi:hypothetical protein